MPAKHEPTATTRKLVKNLALAGFSQQDICGGLEITRPTLRKHYKKELQQGGIEATGQVASKLFRMAMEGNASCAIFWMKTRGGWREGMDINHSSEDGTMTPPRTVSVVGVSAEQDNSTNPG